MKPPVADIRKSWFCPLHHWLAALALALAGWLAVLPGAAQAQTYLVDSSAGVPTTYPWIDISATGTTLALTDDAQSSRIGIGFTFPFGGIGVTEIVIGSNGWQFFSTGSTLYTNTDFPVSNQDLLTLPYWDDLNPRGNANFIRYETVGSAPNRIFVVSYLNIPHYCSGGAGCTLNQTTTLRETFQVQYHEATGDIIYWYQNMSTFGGGWTTGPVPAGGLPEPGATIGVQISATDYTRWSFNTNSIANGMALRFYYTTPYVTPVPFAWYRMDEENWGPVIDSSGNGMNGTVAGIGVTPTGYPHVTPPDSARTGDPGTCGSAAISAGTTARGVDAGFDMNAVGNTGSISFWYSGNTAWNNGTARMLLDASNDLGNNDNADRNFYVVKEGTGRIRFSLEDSGNTESVALTGTNSFAADTWHHIAVTWNLGQDRVRIYLNGVLAATSTTNVNGTLGDVQSLYIGGWRGGTISGATSYTQNSANGYIDEVRIYNIELTVADVAADRARTHSCGAGLHHYAIAVSPSTQVGCLPVAVTITGHTDTDAPVAPGTTINLSTSTGRGSWTLASGSGILTDTTADDGAAGYQYGSGETAVTLNLFHPTLTADPQTVNINVTDGTRTEGTGAEDPNISMRRAALVLYNATDASTVIPVQLAGKRSDTGYNARALELRALRQSDSNPTVCNGMFPGETKAVELGFECITPATCAGQTVSVSFDGGALQPVATNNSNGVSGAPAYSTLNLSFDASSREQIVLHYPDAGQMRLNARTSLTTTPAPTYVDGESDFTVRPFGLGFTNINRGGTANPGGTATAGSVFTSAGNTFAATVGAYQWAAAHDTDNDGIPDSGADITGNGLTPNFAFATALTPTVHTPAGGSAGMLGGTTSILATSFSGGQATVSDLTWSEVGSLYLNGAVTDYLGVSGVAVSGRSGGIGRFPPAYFSLASSAVTAANAGGFSYMSQPGVQIAYTLQAQKVGGGVTTNYDSNTLGYSLVATPALVAENADAGTNLAGRLVTSATPTWTGGAYTFSDSTARFDRAASPDGPYDNLRLGVTTSGGDGVVIQNLDMKATTAGDCTTVPDCDARQIDSPTRTRFGRLRLINYNGSELLPARIEYRAEYWDGNRWRTNTDDSTTSIAAANLATAGLTVSGVTGMTNGIGFLTFNPAAAGAYDIAINLNASGSDTSCNAAHGGTPANLPWLQGYWSTSCGTTPAWQQDPNARVRLGSPRAPHIYLRERY